MTGDGWVFSAVSQLSKLNCWIWAEMDRLVPAKPLIQQFSSSSLGGVGAQTKNTLPQAVAGCCSESLRRLAAGCSEPEESAAGRRLPLRQ